MKKKNNTLAGFVADDNAREISRIHYQFEDLRHICCTEVLTTPNSILALHIFFLRETWIKN